MSFFYALANPNRFLLFVRWCVPLAFILFFICLAVGLFLVFNVPPDYQQGEMVKLMFIHVPSVWLAMFIYVVMASSAFGVLVWRHPLADVAARTAAPIGATFTFLGLISGSIWGYEIWGTWWEWDARLTSFLILFFIYCGLIAFWRCVDEPSLVARPAAIAVLVGAVNLPIIKFSVDWFLTLHQPASILRRGGVAMEWVYLQPLFIMAFAFLSLFVALHFLSMRAEIHHRQFLALQKRGEK